MKKTGIMGGTFNPIHNGHIMLAKSAFEQYELDKILFMPCGVPYMKSDQKVESGEIRAEMTALAIKDDPHFELSCMEIEQQGDTYTYQTLERLKEENPGTDYYFILGADSLFHIEHWRCPERIFTNCRILAAVRGDKTSADIEKQIQLLCRKYDACIHLLQTAYMEISSSDIRRKVRAGEAIDRDVPIAVREYIERRGLYR